MPLSTEPVLLNNAIMPEEIEDLRSYYEAAGYTIPSRTAGLSTSGSITSRASTSSSSGTNILSGQEVLLRLYLKTS